MLKSVLMGTAVIVLAACSANGPSIDDQIEAIRAECYRLPTATERETCAIERESVLLAKTYPYPDLLALSHAQRLAIAGRLDRGDINQEQARIELAELSVRIRTEYENRRAQRGQTVAAILGAAPRQRTCTTQVIAGTLQTRCF